MSSRAGNRRMQSQPWVISLPWLFKHSYLEHWPLAIYSSMRTVEWLPGKGVLMLLACFLFLFTDQNIISRFFVHCIPSLNYALFPLVQTLTSEELRTNLLTTIGMRPRHRLHCGQLGACPEIYNINEASQHLMSIADNQLWLSKKQKKGGDEELRPKNTFVSVQSAVAVTPTLTLETHF